MRISVSITQKRISEMDLDGYAVGGLAVGESHEEMYHILDEVTFRICQRTKPTYLMGVGTPANILEGVERGVDFLRLRIPEPERTSRTRLHQPWKDEPVQSEIRAGSASDRGRLPVPGVPSLQQSLHPSSAESKRDARHASLCSAQPVFLQQYDDRNPDRTGRGQIFASYKRAKLAGFEEYDKK